MAAPALTDGIDPVASYAAVVATLALGWQIYAWSRQHRTRVRVVLTFGLPMGPLGVGDQILMVSVYNDRQHEIRVQSAGFALEDGSKRTAPIIAAPPGATLPGAVAPRTHGQTWTELADFKAQVGSLRIRGFADTTDGKRHLSKPLQL